MPGATILLIDDEPNILTTIRRALELEDYRVEVAGSGPIGLEKLGEFDIDLVMLDVVMPEMDGLEVLAQINETFPKVTTVMMSGNATIETAVQATKLGAHDFIEKPISSDKLLLTVKNALDFARLSRENKALRASAGADFQMVGKSEVMRAVFDKIAMTAPTTGRVLILGANGTGKELVARAIHDHSQRATAPFIKINCAAIPSELIESELFGHEKGAFTGATQQRRGKFELAHSGTLFLDEIGDMTPSAQAKVLRVLQENEFERVGGSETLTCDVRVIAATNKDLSKEIEAGNFREDLYYRLNVVPIELPPLAGRREDITDLSEYLLKQVCEANGRKPKRLEAAAVTLLMQYDWPGNVRELRNIIERIVILTGDAPSITETDVLNTLPGVKKVGANYKSGSSLKDLVAAAERDIVMQALEANDSHISNTAKDLQLERSHLYKKMKALGINPRSADS